MGLSFCQEGNVFSLDELVTKLADLYDKISDTTFLKFNI